ncbi:hypothetical protein B4U80_14178 [Leptotrombidium deliense]|uniref:MATH domain-containing protein n=1 Tax=Leptotrombidium deliense TaxID=299467 RepID=A0A443S0V4_9ACAR|nr:hypothetical protein B4U80_14178 [Leptotrombidium deliense]
MSARKRKTINSASNEVTIGKVKCRLDSSETKFMIDWKIDNFLSYTDEEQIFSKTVFDGRTKRNWKLSIVQKKDGRKCESYTPWVNLEEYDEVENFFFYYKMSFLDSEEREYIGRGHDWWGCRDLLRHQDLIDNKDTWIADSVLHLRCSLHMWKRRVI